MIPFFSGKQIAAAAAIPVGFIVMLVGFFVSGYLVLGGLVAMAVGGFLSYRWFNPAAQLGSAIGELDQALKSDEFKNLMQTMQQTVDEAHQRRPEVPPYRRHIDDGDDDNAA